MENLILSLWYSLLNIISEIISLLFLLLMTFLLIQFNESVKYTFGTFILNCRNAIKKYQRILNVIINGTI